MYDMLYALGNTQSVITMYYWLIDSGGVMPNIQGESIADELVADSGAAVSPSGADYGAAERFASRKQEQDVQEIRPKFR